MFTSDNDELFCSRIEDLTSLCYTRQKPVFSQFLSESKQALAQKVLQSICFENYIFFGGSETSERKLLGVFYDKPEQSAFPVSAIEFKYRACDKLTHRDFLGTLMSLGIERDTVGDILVENGRTVVFVKNELKDYIESQIFKVGGAGVKLVHPDIDNLPQGRGTEEMRLTVSSLRFDNIVAAVSGLSRDKTAKLILSGETALNFSVTQNVSCQVKQGDTFTIRGKGKFKLEKILGVTKKGRHKILVIHFR